MPMHYENPIVYATPDKCVGCKKCEAACVSAHINMPFREAKKRGLPVIPRIKVTKVDNLKFPIQCRHCEDAPCAHACPFGAIRQVDGIVHVKEQLCVGCKMCVMACPFGAIEVGVEGELEQTGRTKQGSAKKCDLCQAWRSSNGKEVCACVEACPKGALQFVDLRQYRQAQAQARVLELAKASALIQNVPSPPLTA
ncbi:Iron-sulfur protein [Fundidesulfovibrio magnetotacticus]|uniref:Iron-sulfur protein n=1 Tax=Fundidesulfovibrio magnetotacticus TaxID=2730080 RepID=A0A6V8LQ81_9BACT|nr:4Fe-4S dicluster domain-containing protein [Fundidesulfovibrio magnetotacticus]GFK94692.1 Iron-sulfur protein [Fundidesulfovibrio magnetotacticus]